METFTNISTAIIRIGLFILVFIMPFILLVIVTFWLGLIFRPWRPVTTREARSQPLEACKIYPQSQLLDSCRAMTPSITPQAIDNAFSDLIACGISMETEPGSGLYKITLESEGRKRFRSIRSLEISKRDMNILRHTGGC